MQNINELFIAAKQNDDQVILFRKLQDMPMLEIKYCKAGIEAIKEELDVTITKAKTIFKERRVAEYMQSHTDQAMAIVQDMRKDGINVLAVSTYNYISLNTKGQGSNVAKYLTNLGMNVKGYNPDLVVLPMKTVPQHSPRHQTN